MRLTDSARDRFFDKNGDPKEIRVIKNETSGCIKVGDDVFEFDILKETGRCEIVEFEYVPLLYLYATKYTTHTHNSNTTKTMVRVADIPHRFVIKQDLNKEYRLATKARTKKAEIKMKRPRTIMFDDTSSTKQRSRSPTRGTSIVTKRSRSVSPLNQSDQPKRTMKKARFSSEKLDTEKLSTTTVDSKTTEDTSRLMSMYSTVMETNLPSKLKNSELTFIISHEEKRARQGQLDVLRAFLEDIHDVLRDDAQSQEDKVAYTELLAFSHSIERRIEDLEELLLESEKARLRLHS